MHSEYSGGISQAILYFIEQSENSIHFRFESCLSFSESWWLLSGTCLPQILALSPLGFTKIAFPLRTHEPEVEHMAELCVGWPGVCD